MLRLPVAADSWAMMSSPAWFESSQCDVRDFASIVEQPVNQADYATAVGVDRGVVLYDGTDLLALADDPDSRRSLLAEFAAVFGAGPGVLIIRHAFGDDDALDAATETFRSIIADEKETGMAPGDHFAAAGSNDRVWNALEKLALRDPATFVRYYSNSALALVSEAWLGPRYQVTSQINQVNPGGVAQSPHRDYHLGFQSVESAQSYPAHVHRMSPALTLQGGVAHDDIPLETGPTFLIPHSHKYGPGYVASQLPEFREYAQDVAVQIPMHKGDAVFFNPALFHGAGSNTSEGSQRLVNLLQVSSAFGRAMEDVDRRRIVDSIYPALLAWKRAGADQGALENAVAASAEGYAFPLDLDMNPPQGSDAPDAQADVVLRALAEEWSAEELAARL